MDTRRRTLLVGGVVTAASLGRCLSEIGSDEPGEYVVDTVEDQVDGTRRRTGESFELASGGETA